MTDHGRVGEDQAMPEQSIRNNKRHRQVSTEILTSALTLDLIHYNMGTETGKTIQFTLRKEDAQKRSYGSESREETFLANLKCSSINCRVEGVRKVAWGS